MATANRSSICPLQDLQTCAWGLRVRTCRSMCRTALPGTRTMRESCRCETRWCRYRACSPLFFGPVVALEYLSFSMWLSFLLQRLNCRAGSTHNAEREKAYDIVKISFSSSLCIMFATQANLVRLVQIASLLKIPFLTEVSSSENQPLPPKVLLSTMYYLCSQGVAWSVLSGFSTTLGQWKKN
jgi:hypothetical protein